MAKKELSLKKIAFSAKLISQKKTFEAVDLSIHVAIV